MSPSLPLQLILVTLGVTVTVTSGHTPKELYKRAEFLPTAIDEGSGYLSPKVRERKIFYLPTIPEKKPQYLGYLPRTAARKPEFLPAAERTPGYFPTNVRKQTKNLHTAVEAPYPHAAAAERKVSYIHKGTGEGGEYAPTVLESEVTFFDLDGSAVQERQSGGSGVEPAPMEATKSGQESTRSAKETYATASRNHFANAFSNYNYANFSNNSSSNPSSNSSSKSSSNSSTNPSTNSNYATSSDNTSSKSSNKPFTDSSSNSNYANSSTDPYIDPSTNCTNPSTNSSTTTTCPAAWTPYRTSCFYLTTHRVSWTSAHHACASLHPHARLATIPDSNTNHFLSALARTGGRRNTWIGLARAEDGWGWSDGTGVMFTYWDRGQPNGEERGQDCVHLRGQEGKWHDNKCDRRMKVMCQVKLN